MVFCICDFVKCVFIGMTLKRNLMLFPLIGRICSESACGPTGLTINTALRLVGRKHAQVGPDPEKHENRCHSWYASFKILRSHGNIKRICLLWCQTYCSDMASVLDHFLIFLTGLKWLVNEWTLHIFEYRLGEGSAWWVYAIGRSVQSRYTQKCQVFYCYVFSDAVTTLVYSLDCFIMMRTLSLQILKKDTRLKRFTLMWSAWFCAHEICWLLSVSMKGRVSFSCFPWPCRKSTYWFSKVHLK